MKSKGLEHILIGLNALAGIVVVGIFVAMYGFRGPLLAPKILHVIQIILVCFFIIEKGLRALNAVSLKAYLQLHWFELPLLLALCAVVFGGEYWLARLEYQTISHFAVGVYLVLQVVAKLSRTTVRLASLGKNPTLSLMICFLLLILIGAGFLCLPRAVSGRPLSFVDALFTATSATCVTGLVVKDTGQDFTMMGQVVILALIQLGGLGIMVFGAVFSLLLGQALTLRESVAMQDLLSARALNRLGNIIGFIFLATLIFETIGTFALYSMWDDIPAGVTSIHQKWFYSIFHAISAFCNAGFGLFSDSMVPYRWSWQVYGVICPLIIVGGLGFGVLYNLCNITADRIKRFFKKLFFKQYRFSMVPPKRLSLQTKIVCTVSVVLIVLGMGLIFLFERCHGQTPVSAYDGILDAFFQSVTARTAGFNTVNIKALSEASKTILILLMFIGGSPGSTAGGIKTVTLAVLLMTVITTLRKRGEVEMFNRSIRPVVVGRAITVTFLFFVVLIVTALTLGITERANAQGFTMSDILFESASALGNVGLTTGVTPFLTTIGKLIIIVVMLVGRLGPLTLLAALTFNLTPARYSYPQEALIVG
jgi:trk system potassium uptake protein TrkH